MSTNAWVTEPEPWLCRHLRWHRWETTGTGAKVCRRRGCLEVRPAQRPEQPTPEALPGEDYWVVCRSHDGRELYSGPLPVPPAIEALADRKARLFHLYEVTLIEFNQDVADA